MAKYNFSTESAENYEQKCLCVLVLDTSGSMSGQPIAELNQGLIDFYEEIEGDETTSQRLEIALISFNTTSQLVQEPALVENVAIPELKANGCTAMVSALKDAIQLVEDRKAWYKSTGQKYYRPWIILMTDGEPTDAQNEVDSLSQKIKLDSENKRYVFLPIGVEGANMNVLKELQGSIPPMKLKGTRFSAFFKWLSASMGSVVKAEMGEKVNLSAGSDSWMDEFYTI